MDKSVTESATEGYYLAYLFSRSAQKLYLSIAIGTASIDEMPVNFITRPNMATGLTTIQPTTGSDDLDEILKMIDAGDFGE